MIHLVVALPFEAKPLIKHYSLKQIEQSPFEIYENSSIRLIVSKTGYLNALSAVMYLGAKFSEDAIWINIGVAGSQSKEIGSLYLSSKISHLEYPKSFYPFLPLKHSLKRAPLLTLNAPSQDYLENTLYDMEAYGFYFGALKFTTLEKAHALKVISDNQKTNLKKLTKTFISNLIEDQMETIDTFIEKTSSLNNAIKPHPDWPLFKERWRLSQTQKIQLKKLLDLLHYHQKDTASFQSLSKIQTSKDLILLLKEKLSDIEVFET